MTGLIHPTAAANWSLGGSMLTWAMPMLLFIAAATVLYLLFSRPHRIPGHSDLVPDRAAPPDPGTAHAMAAAAGMTTAAGTGTGPLAYEPAGAPEAAAAAAEGRPAAVHQPTVPDGLDDLDAAAPGDPGAPGPDGPGGGAPPQAGDGHDPAGPGAGE